MLLYMRIMAFSLNRIIFPVPMKSLKIWVEKTWLSKTLHGISPKSLSSMMKRIGRDQVGGRRPYS